MSQSQAHRKHPVERAQEWDYTGDRNDCCGGIRAAFWPRPSGHKAPADRRDPPLGVAGRGGGGPSRRRVTRHKGDSREAGRRSRSALASHLNCGYRPAAPFLPTQARPPARLSVSFLLRTGRPRSISGLRVSGIEIRAGGAGAGGCGGAARCARVGLPPPLSLALARRGPPVLRAERCPLDLRRVGRCCCCAPGRALCRRRPGSRRRSAARTPGQHG